MSNPARMAAFGEGSSPSLTYEPYYGLREKPFSLSSDPRFLYTGPSHVRAFEQLLAGIKRREGLIVLSGEIGTGKTTLCRGVLGQLDRRTFTTFVRDPFLSREDLLKTLLIDFGVMSIADLKSGRLSGASRPELSYPLYEFLDSLVPLQAFAVLIIDEAQNLSPALLEEIRILSELEAREKLLQVVLVGQPELRANLKLPQLRQVDQRVSVRCELSPLPPDEVARYIAHRLAVAGGADGCVEFSADAARAVWRASGGVPRVINLLCDRALTRGFTGRTHSIDPAIVLAAAEDLGRPADVTVARQTEPHLAGSAESDVTERGVRELGDVAPTPSSVTVGVAAASEPAERAGGWRVDSEMSDPLAEFTHEADLAPPRRYWKAAAMLAAGIALAATGVIGVPYVQDAIQPAATAPVASMLPPSPVRAATIVEPPEAAPEPAAVPAAFQAVRAPVAATVTDTGGYSIQVASFQSRARVRRLVEELAGAGYEAEAIQTDLGPRGVWLQVMVGRYATPDAADDDLARIRELPSYADARVVARLAAD